MDVALKYSGGSVRFLDAGLNLSGGAALPLDWIAASVNVDGEEFEDAWSPLLVALECGSTEALVQTLEAYAAHESWVLLSPSFAVAGSESPLIDFFAPCLALALENSEAAAQLTTALTAVSAKRRVPIPIAALANDGTLRAGSRALLDRWSAWIAVACIVGDGGDSAVPLLRRPLELNYSDLEVVTVAASAAAVATPLTVPSPMDATATDASFTAFVLADIVALVYSYQGLLDRAAESSCNSGALFLCMAYRPPAAEAITVASWLTSVGAVIEARRPWLTAPTPASIPWSNECRLPPSWKLDDKPETRADMLAAALANGSPSDAEAKAAWRSFALHLAQAAFGKEEWCRADVRDSADPTAFALEETRLGLKRFVVALEPRAAPVAAADARPLSLQEAFEAAAQAFGKVAGKHPDSTKLRFYSLFKQGKDGDVTGSRPWAIDFQARAKYDAWASVKGMAKEAAMQTYVDEWTALSAGASSGR